MARDEISSVLLRTLAAASSAKTAGFGVPSFVPKWRARYDSNLPVAMQPPRRILRTRLRPILPDGQH
jgi:hypothetical protein